MTIVLAGLLWVLCICYIGHITIFARSQTELLDRLNVILNRLREHRFKIKISKCVLFRQEIQFLGHTVNSHGIQSLPDKLAAIRDWPVPSAQIWYVDVLQVSAGRAIIVIRLS